jgi:hypothetical protein
MAAPIPFDAPVTKATLPLRLLTPTMVVPNDLFLFDSPRAVYWRRTGAASGREHPRAALDAQLAAIGVRSRVAAQEEP